MKREAGIATLAIVIGIVALAAGAYHWSVVTGKNGTIKDLRAENNRLTTSNGKLTIENERLVGDNKTCADNVDRQNTALAEIKRERDEKDAEFIKAKTASQALSGQLQRSVAEIRAFKAQQGESECAAWERQAREYVKTRKALEVR